MPKYSVHFQYGVDEHHTFPLPINCDLSKKIESNIHQVVVEIEDFIKNNNLHSGKKVVHDVMLYDEKGNGLWGIDDLPEYYRRQKDLPNII